LEGREHCNFLSGHLVKDDSHILWSRTLEKVHASLDCLRSDLPLLSYAHLTGSGNLMCPFAPNWLD